MISGGIQSFLAIFGASAFFFNDVLALISLLGSLLLFLGPFPGSRLERLTSLAEWNSAPLLFGSLFQVSFLLISTGQESETMGLLVPMPPFVVTGLFATSFLLMLGRWWIKRQARVER